MVSAVRQQNLKLMKNITKLFIAPLGIAVLCLAGSCGGRNGWGVSGNIAGASGDTLILESFSAGRWMPVDTIMTADNGDFEYLSETYAPYPDIYRLTRGNESIYFPIDSIDRVTLSANASDFGGGHTLSGTSQAEAFSRVDSMLLASISSKGAPATLGDNALKGVFTEMILQNESLLMPYYLVTKTVAGKPLFNPENRKDLSVIGAVANLFSIQRPEDPRTQYLAEIFTSHKFAGHPGSTVEASLSGIPEDIERFDINGRKQTLSEVADGHPTILSFTRYDNKYSPAYNAELNKVWEQYHAAGLQIYQIAFDEHEATWRTAAANIPWITVWNALTDPVTPIATYNVTAFPTTFILNSNGDLVERVDDPAKLASTVARYL